MKVLLYLKKSSLDKSGQAPIMGRISYQCTMAQFSTKLSFRPQLWNTRESRLNGKSREELDLVQSSKSAGTYRANRTSHKQLTNFVEAEGKGDIPLTAVSIDFFDRYRLYLKGKGYAASSINNYLCWLSRLMYRAVSQQSIRYNPLEDAKYEQVERMPRYLGKADIARLLKLSFPNEQAELVRRMFLFSAFTGLAFADVRKLRYSDIHKSNKG